MSVSCRLVLEYDDIEVAEIVERSVLPDNEGYIQVTVEDGRLICVAEAASPLKLLHTLDDFLACVTVAEETVREKGRS